MGLRIIADDIDEIWNDVPRMSQITCSNFRSPWLHSARVRTYLLPQQLVISEKQSGITKSLTMYQIALEDPSSSRFRSMPGTRLQYWADPVIAAFSTDARFPHARSIYISVLLHGPW